MLNFLPSPCGNWQTSPYKQSAHARNLPGYMANDDVIFLNTYCESIVKVVVSIHFTTDHFSYARIPNGV